ncbi:MAG: ABC transporter substrate-binding protein, partial [Candidatus Sericytochromatia bacterium]|nr:ABC transporter substrate-binding protein [Candidatus Tanganyikabacteria bacterium]
MSLRNRALGAMLAGLLGLTGCLPLGLLTAGDTAATVKIGYMNPLTGDDATYGQNYADACQLAIDHINAAGGVNGQKLELLKGNDQGSGEIGVPVARSLVNQGIVAMVGPGYSGVMKPVLKDVLIPAGVPSIGHSAQDPSLAEPALKAGNNNFRIVTSEDQDALAFSKYFKGEKHSKVVVLSRDNPENKPFAEEFARLVKADGVDAKLIVYDDVDNPNYAAIKAQIPDGTTAIVLAANPGDGKSILDDWYASGQHKDIGWYFYVFIWGFVPDATEKKFLEGRRGIEPIR